MQAHILECHEIIPINLVRGENCTLWDDQGKRYTDFESGIWSTAIGHCHPRINRVIAEQSSRLMHLGTRFPNYLVDEAAAAVLDLVRLDGKCVFLSSGSEAVEFGASMIRRVTGKKRLLTFSNSYLAAYGSAGQKNSEDWYLLDWTQLENPGEEECLERIPFEQLGGFVFEPGGSGSGFVKFPPRRLVENLVRRVKQASGLVMANEVTAGMGRTGLWFGHQHYDVHPDIVTLGKGLGNGYPVSGVAFSRTVAEIVERTRLRYAQSHQNDPLGCAVAKEVIRVMQEDGLVERGAEVGRFFLDGLSRLADQHPGVKEARGRGMLLALEFEPGGRYPVDQAFHDLLAEGFLVGYYPAGNILRFDPALTMEMESIQALLACLDSLLRRNE